MLFNGHAEKVTSIPEQIHTSERIWYLPHEVVITDIKTDKLRVVFDCAARLKGKSLNERCKQGPDLVNKSLHAIQADIESMYHHVRITLDNRGVLRSLWFEKDKVVLF